MKEISKNFIFILLFSISSSQIKLFGPTFEAKMSEGLQQMISEPQTIVPRKPIHWIFALDESKSMEGVRWQKLKTLTDNLASRMKSHPDDVMSVYSFDTRATNPPQKYFQFDKPQNWNSGVLQFRGGSTEFGNAIIRAIQLMLLHRYTNTCLVVIADNFVGVPAIQINLFGQTVAYLKTINTTVCIECYHIKEEEGQQIPTSFDYTCGLLKKPFSSSTPRTYVTTPEQFYGTTTQNLNVFSSQTFQQDIAQSFGATIDSPTFI